MSIIVEADLFVLYCRKNKFANTYTNDNLGKEIRKIIESFGGSLIKKDLLSYWDNNETAKHISPKKLCKTSSQYEINKNQIGNVFVELSKL